MKPLDLHGIRHCDVSRLIDDHIYSGIRKSYRHVEIITGNSPIMKSIVRECLKDYDMEAREEILNTGTLIVDL
jgi:DNA-nicking Smr family endonuclease